MNNKPCALILLHVVLGILLDAYLIFSIPLAICLVLVLTLAYACLAFYTRRSMVYLRTGTLLMLSVLAGGLSHHLQWNVYAANEIGLITTEKSQPMVLRGTVIRSCVALPAKSYDPMDRNQVGARVKLLLWVTACRDRQSWRKISGRVMTTVMGSDDELLVGDQVEVSGFLSKPQVARSPGDFDLALHYRYQRIHALLFVQNSAALRRLDKIDQRYWIWRKLDVVHRQCRLVIHESFSKRSAGLICAMMLGDRHLVPGHVQEQFLVTGTMHLLAISGLHVGILSFGFLSLSRTGWVSRKNCYLATIGFVVFYCLLTGARPPVIRATFLVVLFCLAKLSGKDPVSVNSLSLAGVIVIGINPSSIFQMGAQLSFVAVATLIMVAEGQRDSNHNGNSLDLFLRRKRSRSKRTWDNTVQYFQSLFIASLAVWVATIPLVAKHFHVVAPIGILANVFLMVPVTVLLYLSFLALLGGLIGLIHFFNGMVEYLVQVVLGMIRMSSQVPCGFWWSFGSSGLWLIIFYVGFAFMFFGGRLRLRLVSQFVLFVLWSAVSLCHSQYVSTTSGKKLTVSFIDVGHGTSVLVELPGGRTVLYDAGSLNSSRLAIDRVSAVLWQKRIYRLDAVILSHADLDHYNAIPKLVKRFKVCRVLISPRMFDRMASPALIELNKQLRLSRIPIVEIHKGFQVEMDRECKIQIAHPAGNFRGRSDNANSLVVQLEYGQTKVLLTGDLEKEGFEALLSGSKIDVDVLMVPHHGSSSADHDRLARWSSPDFVVVSSSKTATDSPVVQSYRRVGATPFLTSVNAMITFEITESGIKPSSFID